MTEKDSLCGAEEGNLIHCLNSALLVGFMPIFVTLGVIYSPYFIYMGIRAVAKKYGMPDPVLIP